MAAKIPDAGKLLALTILFASGRNPKLRLFKNNVTVGAGTTLAGLTEADFSGYGAIDISSLSSPAIDGAGKGFREILGNTFTHNGGGTANTCYGWYVTIDDLASSQSLIICENFSTGQVMSASPNAIVFDLTIRDNEGA